MGAEWNLIPQHRSIIDAVSCAWTPSQLKRPGCFSLNVSVRTGAEKLWRWCVVAAGLVLLCWLETNTSRLFVVSSFYYFDNSSGKAEVKISIKFEQRSLDSLFTNEKAVLADTIKARISCFVSAELWNEKEKEILFIGHDRRAFVLWHAQMKHWGLLPGVQKTCWFWGVWVVFSKPFFWKKKKE